MVMDIDHIVYMLNQGSTFNKIPFIIIVIKMLNSSVFTSFFSSLLSFYFIFEDDHGKCVWKSCINDFKCQNLLLLVEMNLFGGR